MLKLKNCLFAYDHAKNQLPEHFENFFKKMGHQHDHLTRNSKLKLEVTKTKTIRFGTYNIKNLVTKDWNNTIPKILTDVVSVTKNTLKHHLRAFFIDEAAN